jgi:hypothetical protein
VSITVTFSKVTFGQDEGGGGPAVVVPGRSATSLTSSDIFSSDDAHVTAIITDDPGVHFSVLSVNSFQMVPGPPPGNGTGNGDGGLPGEPHVHPHPLPHPVHPVQQGQSDGKTPLAVKNGEFVEITVKFVAPPTTPTPNVLSANLQVQGNILAKTVIPLSATVQGTLAIDVPTSVGMFPSESRILPFTVTVVGPPTTVTLVKPLGSQVSGIILSFSTGTDAVSFPVSEGSPARGTLLIRIDSSNFTGDNPNSPFIQVNAFEDSVDMFVHFKVSVAPPVALGFVQGPNPAITLPQGGSTTLWIVATPGTLAPDDWIGINLFPSALPAGVTMSSVSDTLSVNPNGHPSPFPPHNVDATGSRIFALTVTIDPSAPIGQNLPLTVNSSAVLNVFQGVSSAAAPVGSVPATLTILPAVVTSHAVFDTAAFSGLGGSMDLTLRQDGSYTVAIHMSNSSRFVAYDYSIRATFTAANSMSFLVAHSGHVGPGTVFGEDAHDDPIPENGMHPFIRQFWPDVVKGNMSKSLAYDASGGPLGFLEDVAKDIAIVVTGGAVAGAAGAGLGFTFALTQQAGKLFNDGLGRSFSIIAGVVAFPIALVAGATISNAVIFATVAGVTIGNVASGNIQHRPISQAEYDFANATNLAGSNPAGDPDNDSVFMGALPAMDRLVLTNFCNPDRGRAFTVPALDGSNKIFLNLGNAYDPIDVRKPGGIPGTTAGAYPAKGQVLIHELVHAEQIDRNNVWGIICSGIFNGVAYIFGDNVYKFGPAGPDFRSSYFNLESQAAVVDHWFGGMD